jgi:hypothetical protein
MALKHSEGAEGPTEIFLVLRGFRMSPLEAKETEKLPEGSFIILGNYFYKDVY